MNLKHFVAFFLPLTCNCLKAQIPVTKEPRHKLVLENAYIRLLDVHIDPKDTTLYHIHAAPSVIVHITRSLIGAQNMGGAIAAPGEVLPGYTRYAAYDRNPI